MAKDKKRSMNVNKIKSLMGSISGKMDDLYKDTYSIDKSSSDDLDTVMANIDKSIEDIMSKSSSVDVPNITQLLTKMSINNLKNDKKFINNVVDIFNDTPLQGSLMTAYSSNKWIRALDDEIDTICKYVPKLEQALQAKLDAVLTADSNDKSFLNVYCSSLAEDNQLIFSRNIEQLKKKYELETRLRQDVNNTQRYGEEYTYLVPYKRALKTIMDRRNQPSRNLNANSMYLQESMIKTSDVAKAVKSISINDLPENFKDKQIKVNIDTSGYLESALVEYNDKLEAKKTLYEHSLINEASLQPYEKKMFDNVILRDDLEVPKSSNDYTNDGFIDMSKSNTDDIKIMGGIMKRLDRANLIPIIMGGERFGYFYLEFEYDDNILDDSILAVSRKSTIYGTTMSADMKVKQNEARTALFKHISRSISDKIDANFINANPNLSKYIYAILDYNDMIANNTINNIRVTFLPEEDVHVLMFNKDEETGRGISDLLGALFPGKLYACLYITNLIGELTRGQDKRVYYVKQNIETNISQTMLNVMNQIKKSNFNLRQVENLNSILNITGRFNDFYIPVGPSGDAPIQFEVMPGQEVRDNSDLLERLEDMCISATDVPPELIANRLSVDFAAQITSTNLMFVRYVYARQAIIEEYESKLISVLYEIEYGEKLDLKVMLPAPIFINATNISNILNSITQNAQTIAESEYGDDQSEEGQALKALFIKIYIRGELGTYLRVDKLEQYRKMAELEYERAKAKKKKDDI